jgi:branched-chain amino acid transport system ATP-binding protein
VDAGDRGADQVEGQAEPVVGASRCSRWRALAARPRVLLADELSLGLAPIIVRRLLSAVRSAARDGVGVLLVEQHVRQALGIADRVCVLQRGRIVFEADASQAAARIDQIEKAYLEGVEVR